MNRKFVAFCAALVAISIGGCLPEEIGLEDLDLEGSRVAIDFEITAVIRHETENTLEAQSVTITSWRMNATTGQVEADTTIETRYTTPAGAYTAGGAHAEVKALRGYNVGDHERIVFQIISTGATTQGTATSTYQKGQATVSIWTGRNTIRDQINVTVSNITTQSGN